MISKHLKYTLFTLVLFCLSFTGLAQSVPSVVDFYNYPDQPNGQYFKSYLNATKTVFTAPLHWNNKQWVAAAGVTAAGVLLYIYDDEVRTFFLRNSSHALDEVSKYVFEPWGNGLYPAIAMGGYYVYGLAFDDQRARQIALGGTQAWVMSAFTVQVLKNLTHRHRPNQDLPANPRLWEGPFKGFSYTSFPSGHTITAFSLAAFMSSVYHEKLWVSILAYGLASGVGLSRVYDDKHWSSDVLIGAALGFAIGKTVYRLMQPGTKLSLAAGINGNLALVYRF